MISKKQRAGARFRHRNNWRQNLLSLLGRQRGAALLVVLLLAGIAVAAGLLSYYNSTTLTLKSDQSTADDLARTRDALIAYAIRGPNRPGEFPCPDTKLPTDLNYGTQEGTCSVGRLGRVPWKTLGIPEPKDSSGETLWYTVADRFRPVGSYNGILNNDTRGSITVHAADGTTALTTEAVAVVFAPGPATGTQNRAANVSAPCTMSPSSPTQLNRCATNYLDLVTSTPFRHNATPPTVKIPEPPFIVIGRLPDPSYPNYNPNFNDKLLYITTSDFMPQVEQRLIRELKVLLEDYRSNSVCQCYPWADTWWPILKGISDVGQNRGHFPTNAAPELWGSGSIPTLPTWFPANDWQHGIWYSVARQNASANVTCRSCSSSPTLIVDGKPGVSALLLFPGPAIGKVPRPSEFLTDYFEDAENTNGRGTACPETGHIGSKPLDIPLKPTPSLICDTYVTPTSKARDRDRLLTFTSPPAK